MPYIYKITNNINNKVYIGKTAFSIDQRFKKHCYDAFRDENEHRPLYAAIRKYGVDNFSISLIEETDKPEEREKYWIEYYGSFKNGYNATLGGDGRRYLDYELILSTFRTTKSAEETARLCNCCPEQVRKILHSFGETLNTNLSKMKPVAKLDKDTGEILAVYSSIAEAEAENGNTRHIAEVCKGKRKLCKGFKWKYL